LFIGVNATLRNSITIAPETLIGAGSIIMKDTKSKGVHRYMLYNGNDYGRTGVGIAVMEPSVR